MTFVEEGACSGGTGTGASDVEKRRGQRFQAVATDLPGHHHPKLDALHRNHAGVETIIKDAKTSA